jgi:hypothetical protein
MLLPAVAVEMAVHGARAFVAMIVIVIRHEVPGPHSRDAASGVGQTQDTEQDEHGGHEQLEAGGHSRGEDDVQGEQEAAGERECRHVAETPERAHQRAGGQAALTRDDGGHRYEVIRIGRVLQPEDEPERDGRQERVEGYGRSPRSLAITPTS